MESYFTRYRKAARRKSELERQLETVQREHSEVTKLQSELQSLVGSAGGPSDAARVRLA